MKIEHRTHFSPYPPVFNLLHDLLLIGFDTHQHGKGGSRKINEIPVFLNSFFHLQRNRQSWSAYRHMNVESKIEKSFFSFSSKRNFIFCPIDLWLTLSVRSFTWTATTKEKKKPDNSNNNNDNDNDKNKNKNNNNRSWRDPLRWVYSCSCTVYTLLCRYGLRPHLKPPVNCADAEKGVDQTFFFSST